MKKLQLQLFTDYDNLLSPYSTKGEVQYPTLKFSANIGEFLMFYEARSELVRLLWTIDPLLYSIRMLWLFSSRNL